MRFIRRATTRILWSTAIALAIIWISSAWLGLGWCSKRGTFVWLEGGRLWIVLQDIINYPTNQVGLGWGRGNSAFAWWYESEIGSRRRGVAVPLWPVIILTAAMAVWARRYDLRSRRRESSTHCPRCDYDCSGLPMPSTCPECGTPTLTSKPSDPDPPR